MAKQQKAKEINKRYLAETRCCCSKQLYFCVVAIFLYVKWSWSLGLVLIVSSLGHALPTNLKLLMHIVVITFL